ncbi:DUF4113 domain-containing protein [Halopseudomonas sp.]|uniref:DUF4113 domain-containing protein n=1 Tax=Halopseudomonas sp. TaxID=2901191 RepID=UPI003FA5E271
MRSAVRPDQSACTLTGKTVSTKSEWQMQRQLLSAAFTTRFDQLWTVRAGPFP